MRHTGGSALGHYLRVLRRGWWIIAATATLVTALAVVFSLSQEDLYEAHADVFLSGTRNLPSDLVGDSLFLYDPERASNTQSRLARVPAVAARAVEEAGLPDRSAAYLLSRSSVSIPPDTDILRFFVTEGNAELAGRLATAYATAYTEYRRELDTRALVRARRQIERRLRAVERNSGLYEQLAEQAQQLRTAEALQESNVAVLREQSGQAAKIQPRPRRNAFLGAIFGLLLGVALVFVREALNTRVRSPEEVEHRLGLPSIGRIPAPRRRMRGAEGLMMLNEPYAPGAEVFRLLATNLGFVNLDRGAKSIMFTSATTAEGKSTTIGNVAVALARTGLRVSLVDLDLKRPALDKLFDLDAGQPGLTSVALGMTDLREALIEIPLGHRGTAEGGRDLSGGPGRLDLLPTGPLPPDTARFVASPTVSEILDRLAERSDLLLIDSPPILQVSDAMALAGKVDAVVAVVRLSIVRRQALDELRRVLDNAPVAKLGFVLTGVPATESYGYGYGYGYSGDINGAASKGRRKERVL